MSIYLKIKTYILIKMKIVKHNSSGKIIGYYLDNKKIQKKILKSLENFYFKQECDGEKSFIISMKLKNMKI